MVKHIVFWNVADEHEGMDKPTLIAEIKRRIEAMRDEIPQIAEIEVGIDFNRSQVAYDIALYSSFASRAALDEYQRHPAHEAVKAFVGSATIARAVVDYEV